MTSSKDNSLLTQSFIEDVRMNETKQTRRHDQMITRPANDPIDNFHYCLMFETWCKKPEFRIQISKQVVRGLFNYWYNTIFPLPVYLAKNMNK